VGHIQAPRRRQRIRVSQMLSIDVEG
jgi:hypothetical protein